MNYYIQGNAAKAQQIKAAFEKLGIDVLDFGFADKTVVYCSIGGACVQSLPYGINLMHILHSHPGYKELELPAEPKFKVGDWVVYCGQTYQITHIGEATYTYTSIKTGSFFFNSIEATDNRGATRLWTIADAKDGDVLVYQDEIFLANLVDDNSVLYHCCFDGELVVHSFYTLSNEDLLHVHPATKEQRDLLFAKMREAGYTWDEKKKKLKKIQPHYDIANFKPFDKVLTRGTEYGHWNVNLFSYYIDDKDERVIARFRCINSLWKQCIPFNDDTKHLLGTTDPCGEEYINW